MDINPEVCLEAFMVEVEGFVPSRVCPRKAKRQEQNSKTGLDVTPVTELGRSGIVSLLVGGEARGPGDEVLWDFSFYLAHPIRR